MKSKLILAAPVCLLLAACGGGGGGPEAKPQDVTPSRVEYKAYAEPAGALCATRRSDASGEYCAEPTSSSTTQAALLQELLDPAGRLVKFSLPGFSVIADARPLAQPVYRGVVEQAALVGHGTISLEGRLYTLDATGSTAQDYTFANPADGRAYVAKDGGVYDGRAVRREFLRLVNESSGANWIAFDYWTSYIGLRTDWSDAPVDKELVFRGTAVMDAHRIAPDPVASGQPQPTLDAVVNCEVIVRVDVPLQSVAITPTSCSEDGHTAALAVRGTLTVAGARIALGTAELAYTVRSADGTLAQENLPVTLVTGGIYGSQAATLYIEGHSGTLRDMGGLRVFARRVSP